jgi:hypothetical protein
MKMFNDFIKLRKWIKNSNNSSGYIHPWSLHLHSIVRINLCLIEVVSMKFNTKIINHLNDIIQLDGET